MAGFGDEPLTEQQGGSTKADIKRAGTRSTLTFQEQDRLPTEQEVTRQKRRGALLGGLSQAKNVSAPDLQKPTGVVLGLLAANLLWTIWRTTVTSPGKLIHKLPQAVAGLWVVGLGVLILAEFNARLAMLFMVLVTIGNVLFNSAANQSAITALNSLFGQRKG